MEELFNKLQREKNLTNLQNLYDEIIKEKDSFHSLKPQLLNDILLLILNNKINPDIQKKIILFYIDLFFLQKFNPESIDKIQIQTLLNNIYDLYQILPSPIFFQSYFDRWFPKDPIQFEPGIQVDILVREQELYFSWTKATIASINNDNKTVELLLPNSSTLLTYSMNDWRIYPNNTFATDFEWRQSLQKDDIIDILSKNNVWLKGTVIDKQGDTIKVGYRIYNNENSFYGFGPKEDISLNIYDFRIRKYETLSFNITHWERFPNEFWSCSSSNLNNMFIPFTGKNYTIPTSSYNAQLELFSLDYIDIQNYVIEKTIEILKEENQDKWIYNFDYLIILVHLLTNMFNSLSTQFAITFLPKVYEKLFIKGFLEFSNDSSKNYKKKEIEQMIKRFEDLMLSAFYPFDFLERYLLFSIEFSINCIKKGQTLEKRLLGLNILQKSLKEENLSDDIIALLNQKMIQCDEHGNNFFDLIYNANNHIEIIKKTSTIIEALFRIKLITKTEIDKLYNYMMTFKSEPEIINDIYQIMNKSVSDMSFEVKKYIFDRIMDLPYENLCDEDMSLLISICNIGILYEEKGNLRDKELEKNILNKVYEYIVENGKKKDVMDIITKFSNVLTMPEKEYEKLSLFMTYFEKSVNDLYSSQTNEDFLIHLIFIKSMLSSIDKYKSDMSYKVKYAMFTQNNGGDQLKKRIVYYAKNMNQFNKQIFYNLSYIFEWTAIQFLFTEADIIELFDLFVFHNSHLDIRNSFLTWVNQLIKVKVMDISNSLNVLFSNLNKYFTENELPSKMNEELTSFFYKIYSNQNSKGDNNVINNKYFDTMYNIIISSESMNVAIDFLSQFVLQDLSPEERGEIWREFTDKIFVSLEKSKESNNSNQITFILRFLSNFIRVTESMGTGYIKPHWNNRKENIKKVTISDTITGKSFVMEINVNDTVYEVKKKISEKINFPHYLFSLARFPSDEGGKLTQNGESVSLFLYLRDYKMYIVFSEMCSSILREKIDHDDDNNGIKRLPFDEVKILNQMFHDLAISQNTMKVSALYQTGLPFVIEGNKTELTFNEFKECVLKLNLEGKHLLQQYFVLHYKKFVKEIINTKNYQDNIAQFLPRAFIAQNQKYFETILLLQNSLIDEISFPAENIISILETNNEMFNNLIDNSIDLSLLDSKDEMSIVKSMYMLQIAESFFEIKTDQASTWISRFVYQKDDNTRKTKLEEMILKFTESFEISGKKVYRSRYQYILNIIDKSLIRLIDNKDFSALLENDNDNYDKSANDLSVDYVSQILKNPFIPKKEVFISLFNKVIKDFPSILEIDSPLFQRECSSNIFHIIIVAVSLFYSDIMEPFFAFINDRVFNKSAFIGRLVYMSTKIILNLVKNIKDENSKKFMEYIFKMTNQVLINENKKTEQKNSKFFYKIVIDVITLNVEQIASSNHEEIINPILSLFYSNSSSFEEETLSGYFTIIQTLIDNLPFSESSFDFEKLLDFLINNFLITEVNQFNSIIYTGNLFDLISSILKVKDDKKSIQNIEFFFKHEKIKNIFKYITVFSLGERGYKPTYRNSSLKAPFAGINNLGAICYMNSILQQFFMIKQLRQEILKIPNENKNLLYELQKMFGFLALTKRESYNPKTFIEKFKDIDGNPTNPFVQCDAQEFLSRFIEQIEEELKFTPYRHLLYNYLGGETCSILKCTNSECDKVSKRYEKLYYLSLDIKKCSSLRECLRKCIQEEVIEDYKCDKCNQKVTHKKNILLSSLPNILIIHLQRIAFNYETFEMEKLNSLVSFEQNISLKDYCMETEGKKDEEYKYKLVGIVVHVGNAQGGHYYSYINAESKVRKDKDNKLERTWYEFNDKDVKNYKGDISETFGNEIESIGKDKGNAYMLIYEKEKKKGMLINKGEIKEGMITKKTEKELREVLSEKDMLNKEVLIEENQEVVTIEDYPTIVGDKENCAKEIENEVTEDNIHFMNDMKIYSVFFDKFLGEIINKLSSLTDKDKEIISSDKILSIVKTTFDILIKILSRSFYKDNITLVIDGLISLAKTHKEILVPYLIEQIKVNETLMKDSLFSQDKSVEMMSLLIGKVIAMAYSTGIKIPEAKSIIEKLLDMIPKTVMPKVNAMEFYWRALFIMLEESEEVTKLFIENNYLYTFIDFFISANVINGNQSKIKEYTEYCYPKFRYLPYIVLHILNYYKKNNLTMTPQLKDILMNDIFIERTMKYGYSPTKLGKIFAILMKDNEENSKKIMIKIEEYGRSTSKYVLLLKIIKHVLDIDDNLYELRLYFLFGIQSFISYSKQSYIETKINNVSLNKDKKSLIYNLYDRPSEECIVITTRLLKMINRNEKIAPVLLQYSLDTNCKAKLIFEMINKANKIKESLLSEIKSKSAFIKKYDKELEEFSSKHKIEKVLEDTKMRILCEKVKEHKYTTSEEANRYMIKVFETDIQYVNDFTVSAIKIYNPSYYFDTKFGLSPSTLDINENHITPICKVTRLFIISKKNCTAHLVIPSLYIDTTIELESSMTNEIAIRDSSPIIKEENEIAIDDIKEKKEEQKEEKEKQNADTDSCVVTCPVCGTLNKLNMTNMVYRCIACESDLFG